jgi:hypothetical protein
MIEEENVIEESHDWTDYEPPRMVNLDDLSEEDIAEMDREETGGELPEIPEETEEEKVTEDTPEEENIEYSLIDDEFIPKKANDEWYKENYSKLLKHIHSEQFVNKFADGYKEHLIKKEEHYTRLKALDELFSEKPELAFKTYAPQYLIKNGIDARYTPAEMNDQLVGALKERFGANYEDKYDIEEAEVEGSLSNKMINFQRQYIADYNKNIEELYAQNKPMSEEDINKAVAKTYHEEFKPKGFTEDEYAEFIDEVKNYKPSLVDFHRIVYFKNYIQDAYTKGLEEGKNSVLGNIKRAGQRITPQSGEKKPEEPITNAILTSDDIFNRLKEKTYGNTTF